ncbi:Gibberellin-regulated protein 1 [Turnera subulata]|uniref:Gibberellin-regulated protein 1 n=1 Tax=Turnera subulata TaxID=218843 RepID=A0A9Q0G7F8_9ROSI|nr:Gibberellin-regulated protein 1 [Turnera subulata]
MAISKFAIASFFISLLVLHLVEADHMVSSNQAPSTPTKRIDCGSACAARCQLSSRPRLCKRACGTCCARCNCVPKGTSGYEQACPCYLSLTTHGGKRKCP